MLLLIMAVNLFRKNEKNEFAFSENVGQNEGSLFDYFCLLVLSRFQLVLFSELRILLYFAITFASPARRSFVIFRITSFISLYAMHFVASTCSSAVSSSK